MLDRRHVRSHVVARGPCGGSDETSKLRTGELLLTGDHGYVCHRFQPCRLSVRRLAGKVLDLLNLLAQIGWCPYAGPYELLTHPDAGSHLAIDQRCDLIGNGIDRKSTRLNSSH